MARSIKETPVLYGDGAKRFQERMQDPPKVSYVGYWSAENSRGEIDFLIQNKEKISPIEVKAEENLKARSLWAFVAKNPQLHGIRLSMSGYREQDWMTNYPLFSLPFLFEAPAFAIH